MPKLTNLVGVLFDRLFGKDPKASKASRKRLDV